MGNKSEMGSSINSNSSQTLKKKKSWLNQAHYQTCTMEEYVGDSNTTTGNIFTDSSLLYNSSNAEHNLVWFGIIVSTADKTAYTFFCGFSC